MEADKFSSGIDTRYYTSIDTEPEMIEGIRTTLVPLVKHVRRAIMQGQYSVIISDESSGRLPSLILQRIINNVNDSKGLPHIQVLFYPATQGVNKVNSGELERRLQEVQMRYPKGRALIVTERISGGWHVGNMSDEITAVGYPHDVATLRSDFTSKYIQNTIRRQQGYSQIAPRGRIFIGKVVSGDSVGYVESDGLKGTRHDIELVEGVGERHYITAIRDPEVQRLVVETRQRIKVIADELTHQFFK